MLHSTQQKTKSWDFQKIDGTGEHYIRQNMSDSEKQIMQDLYVYHSNVYMTQRNEIMYGGMERPKESGGRKEEKIKGK